MRTCGFFLLVGLLAFGLVGCGGGVDHYEVAKAPRAPAGGGNAGNPSTSTGSGAWRWQAPDHWTTGSGSSMRLATLVVPHGEERGDLSISVFGGDLVGNVNRWRGQVGLDALAAAAVEQQAVRIQAPVGEMLRFLIVNPAKRDQAILAALHFAADGVLFVKLTASADCCEAALTAFDAFLATFARTDAVPDEAAP